MTLEIQKADGSRHELEFTSVGSTIKNWWPDIQGDLADRGYPGAYLVEVAPPPPPPPVPTVVGKGQGTIWLHRAGKLAAIEAYIAGSSDDELKLWWKTCIEFKREHPYVVALAEGFAIDIDTAFREAALI